MAPDDLKRRIAGGENLSTEFKAAAIHPDDLAAGLVAFANTDGGVILFGVGDHGEILGIADIDGLARQIDNVSRGNCLPPVTVVPRRVDVEGKSLLMVQVPRGEERPYATNRGVYYVRTFSGRRQAAREELLRLFQASQSLLHDEQVVQGATLLDLDHSYFEHFLLQAYGKRLEDFHVTREQLLQNLRLAKDGRPTVAGLLLFGRDVEKFLPHAQINAAQFSGVELADAPTDRKDLTGKLVDQLEGAMRFLKAFLRVQHKIEGLNPERNPEIPEEAVREALVNAVAHRDYTIRGPVRLLVFRDRLEIHSPGKPPNTIDVEAMKLGTHLPRNPILLSHLAKMGFVTSLGSGVPRILKLVPGAEIAIRGIEVVVTLPRPALPA